jgi:hypothetical protein
MRKFVTLAIILALPLTLYAAAYLCAVQRDWGVSSGYLVWLPEYRFGAPYSRTLFRPAHDIDRRIRYGYWHEPAPPGFFLDDFEPK